MSVLSDEWGKRLDKWFTTREEKGDFTIKVKLTEQRVDHYSNVKAHSFLIEEYLESEKVTGNALIVHGFAGGTVLDFVKLAYGKLNEATLQELLGLWKFCTLYGTDLAKNKVWGMVENLVDSEVQDLNANPEWADIIDAVRSGDDDRVNGAKLKLKRMFKDAVLKPLKPLFGEPLAARELEGRTNVQKESSSSQQLERVAIDPANETPKAALIPLHGTDVASQQAIQAIHSNEDIDSSCADEAIIVKEEVMLDDDDDDVMLCSSGDEQEVVELSTEDEEDNSEEVFAGKIEPHDDAISNANSDETSSNPSEEGHVWVTLKHIRNSIVKRDCCTAVDPNKWETIVRAQKPGTIIHLPEGNLSFPTDYIFDTPRLTITGAGQDKTILCWHPKGQEIDICNIGSSTTFENLSVRYLEAMKTGWPIVMMEGDGSTVRNVSLYNCGLRISSRNNLVENVSVFGDPKGKEKNEPPTNIYSCGIRILRKTESETEASEAEARMDAGPNTIRNVKVRDIMFGIHKEYPSYLANKYHFSDKIGNVECCNVKFGMSFDECYGDKAVGLTYKWDANIKGKTLEDHPTALKVIGGQNNEVEGVHCSGTGNCLGVAWIKKGSGDKARLPLRNVVKNVSGATKSYVCIGFSKLDESNQVLDAKKGIRHPSVSNNENVNSSRCKRKQQDSEAVSETISKRVRVSISIGKRDENGDVSLDVEDISSERHGSCCSIIDVEKWDAIVRSQKPGSTIKLPKGKLSFPDQFCIIAPGITISGQGLDETTLCWHPKQILTDKERNYHMFSIYESITFQNLTIVSSVKIEQGWPFLRVAQNNCKVKNLIFYGCGLWIASRANSIENIRAMGEIGEPWNSAPKNEASCGVRIQAAEEWIEDPGPNVVKGVKVRDTYSGVYKRMHPLFKKIKDRTKDEIKSVECENVVNGMAFRTCSETLLRNLRFKWDLEIDAKKLLPTAVLFLGAKRNTVEGVACSGNEGIRVAYFKKFKGSNEGRTKIQIPEMNVVRRVTGADKVTDEGSKGSNKLENVDADFVLVRKK